MSDLKNVVIVGASSGAALARQLEKKLPSSHRIVLIDSNESAYWPIGGLRAAVKPGSEEQMFAPLKGFFKEGSRHVVLPLTKVTAISNSSVTLEEAREGFGTEIPLDLGVIATGSTYPSPMRSEDAVTSEAKAALKKKQDEVARAESILIVGGGPVGIEFAGEVKDVHPDKKVTLCTSGKTLLSPDWKPAFPSKLHNQLVKLGVTIQYEAKIDLPDSVKSAELLSEPVEISTPAGPLKTDFVLIASGGAPNTQLLPAAALDDAKRIKVNATSLRVEHAELDKWFAIGDANNAPGSKTYMSASAQAPAIAANIVAALFQSNTIKAYKPPGAIMVVPIGTSGGASQLSIVVLGEWVTALAKGKGLLLGMFKGTYGI